MAESNVFPRDFLRLFDKPSFTFFSLSVFSSQVAYQLMNVTLIFLVYYLTSSTLAVSFLILSFLVPQILFSFLGGIVADIQSKKKILIWGNVLRGLLILTLFFYTESLVLVFGVCVLVSIVTQFYVPAEPPFIPQIVSRKRLVLANSIFGISLFGSILVAFVLAGPLIQILGRSTVFLVIGLLFIGSGVLAAFLPEAQRRDLDSDGLHILNFAKSYYNDFVESASLLRRPDNVGASFFLLIFSQSIILILASVVPDFANSILHVPAENLSIVLFAPAALGMIIASLAFGGRIGRVRPRIIATVGVFMSGFALVLFSLMPVISERLLWLSPLFITGVIAFIAGSANAFIFVPSQATIQEKVPENFRAKVYGLLFAFAGIMSLIPILLAGGLTDVFGVGLVLSLLGASILLLGVYRLKDFLT